MKLVAVAGTGTEVGKTWFAASLARELLARGSSVACRKPAQSYDEGTRIADTDAGILAAATADDPHRVCLPHRWYATPMAPPMAADVLGQPAFRIADLASELAWPDGVDVGLLEGAGGVRSPIASDGDLVDLLAVVRPALTVVVADAQLGMLNSVRMSVDALPAPVVVFVNRHDESDDLHRRNLAWLLDEWELSAVTTVAAVADRMG